jgi:uncharacterized protein (TIGR02611 family)
MFRQAWQKFKRRRPGFRFHAMYAEHQKSAKAPWVRVAYVIAGIVVLLVGIVALPAPGPGMLIVALGAGIIARESEKLANALDRFEVVLRRKWRELRPSHR